MQDMYPVISGSPITTLKNGIDSIQTTIDTTHGLFDIQQVALYNALSGGEMLISVAEVLGNKGDDTWVYERDFILIEVV